MSLKFTCGPIPPSGCTLYTGDIPDFIEDASCNMMLDELLERYGVKIQEIIDSLDLTELDPQGMSFDPATIDIKGLHQAEIDELDSQGTRITILEGSLADIGSQTLTLNLGCLTPAAAPCAQGNNTYSILSLFSILFNEICQIKSQLP